jgi:hypothetical protein
MQKIEFKLGSEYMNRMLRPIFIGGALAVIVLLSYVLFFLISLCCKCCSKNRGFCQRAKPKPYMRRIPFIALIVMCAAIGAIGGIMVMAGGPALIGAIHDLVGDILEFVRSAPPSVF